MTCGRLKIYFTFSQFPFVIRLKKKLNLLVFVQHCPVFLELSKIMCMLKSMDSL